MTDVAALAFSIAAVVISGMASLVFIAWFRQRERERLSATDKAELVKRLDEVDGKIRELKNTASAARR